MKTTSPFKLDPNTVCICCWHRLVLDHHRQQQQRQGHRSLPRNLGRNHPQTRHNRHHNPLHTDQQPTAHRNPRPRHRILHNLGIVGQRRLELHPDRLVHPHGRRVLHVLDLLRHLPSPRSSSARSSDHPIGNCDVGWPFCRPCLPKTQTRIRNLG